MTRIEEKLHPMRGLIYRAIVETKRDGILFVGPWRSDDFAAKADLAGAGE